MESTITSDIEADASGQQEGSNVADAANGQNGDAAAQAPASSASHQDILGNESTADIRAWLARVERGEEAGELEVWGQGEEQQEHEQDSDAGEQQQEEAAQADDSQGEGEQPSTGKRPNRLRIADFSQDEQGQLIAARALVKKNPGMKLAQALKQVGMYDSEAAADAIATEEQQTQRQAPAAKTDPVADLTAQIVALSKEYQEAHASFDTDKAAELQAQILDLSEERTLLKGEARNRQANSKQRHEQAVEATVDLVAAAMPDFKKQGTALNKAASELAEEIQANNPRYFENPEWPKKLARLAWAEAHPDEPFPSFEKQAPAQRRVANQPVAKKPGTPVAMLAGGRGTTGTVAGSLEAKVLNGTASDAELRNFLREQQ